MTWWSPGEEAGWLSRRWVQVVVVPLPGLTPAQIEVGLKYKIQTMLPTPDQEFSTRWFRLEGRMYGVAVLNRFGERVPQGSKVLVGVALQLPRSWPGQCFVAVATPDGWDLHWFSQRVLSHSYPPLSSDSSLAARYLDEHSGDPVYWVNPGNLSVRPPEWAIPAPVWPRNQSWGFPWTESPAPKWPWWLGGVFLAGALVLVALGLGHVFDSKTRRNQEWRQWADQVAVVNGQSALSSQRIQELRNRSGVPFFEIMNGLHHVWTDQVEVQRIAISGTKLTLTARATSAVAAVDLLDNASLPLQFRVVEIRQTPIGEDFDLEGEFVP